jgi:5'-methylthioadenosine phosphorylase
MEKADVGVIGGSGLYDSSMLGEVSRVLLKTFYGEPSDAYYLGNVGSRRIAFLSRHGHGHRIPPHELNFKANINGFEQLGAKRIIACCAVGSLKEEYAPGDIVIPDQFIDFKKTMATFYGIGDVTHVSLADPFCAEIRKALMSACKDLGITYHSTGTYVCVEGPRFSTRAESLMFRSFADVIGMTGVPEAILARERELCLGILATVTDYDCWSEKAVCTDDVLRKMKESQENVKQIIKGVIDLIPKERSCVCKDALKGAKA